MSTETSIDLVIGGVVMPFIIAVINQSRWNVRVRGMVAFLACLVMAALLALLHGDLTVAAWRDTAILVTGSAMAMYHALWRPSGLAPAVQDATSIGGPSTRPDTDASTSDVT
jgi:hypothetical protein